MTRDDILNMPAGYGMRKLLGEKVMGWNQQGKWWVGIASVICPVSVWKPDENIAAAWDVADKINRMIAENILELENDYNYLTLECVGYTSGYAASFDCIFENEWFEDITNYKYAARAETAQLAICRAALLAVMEDAE